MSFVVVNRYNILLKGLINFLIIVYIMLVACVYIIIVISAKFICIYDFCLNLHHIALLAILY